MPRQPGSAPPGLPWLVSWSMQAWIMVSRGGANPASEVGRQALFECRGISKRFGATVAVADVTMALYAGETRAILGENGAGKSTLIRDPFGCAGTR